MHFLTLLKSGVSVKNVALEFVQTLLRKSWQENELSLELSCEFVNDLLNSIGLETFITPEQINAGGTYDWPLEQIQIYNFHYVEMDFNKVEEFLCELCSLVHIQQEIFINDLKDLHDDDFESPVEFLMQLMAVWCNVFKQLLKLKELQATKRFEEPLARINFHLLMGMHVLRKSYRLELYLLDAICNRLYWSAVQGLFYKQTHDMIFSGLLDIFSKDFDLFYANSAQTMNFFYEAISVEINNLTPLKLYQALQQMLQEVDTNDKTNILINFLIEPYMLQVYFNTFLAKKYKWYNKITTKNIEKIQQEAIKFLNILQSKIISLDCFSREFMESILNLIFKSEPITSILACNLYITMMKRKFSEQMILKHIMDFYVAHVGSITPLKSYIFALYNSFEFLLNFNNLLEIITDSKTNDLIRLLSAHILVIVFELKLEKKDSSNKQELEYLLQILPEIFENLHCQKTEGILLKVFNFISIEKLKKPILDNLIHYAVGIFTHLDNNLEYPLLMNIFQIFHKCLNFNQEWQHLELLSEHLLRRYREMLNELKSREDKEQQLISKLSLEHYNNLLKRLNIILKTKYDLLDNNYLLIIRHLSHYFLYHEELKLFIAEEKSFIDIYVLEIIISCILKLLKVENENNQNYTFFPEALDLFKYLWQLVKNLEDLSKLTIIRIKTYFYCLLHLFSFLPLKLDTQIYHQLVQILIIVNFKTKTTNRKDGKEMQQLHPLQSLEYQRLMLRQFTEMHKYQRVEIHSNTVWKLCIYYGMFKHNFQEELKSLLITLANYRLKIYKHIISVLIYNLYNQTPHLKHMTIVSILKQHKHLIDNDIKVKSTQLLKVHVVLMVLQILEKALSVQRLKLGHNRLEALRHLHIFIEDLNLNQLQAKQLMQEQLEKMFKHLLNAEERKFLDNFQMLLMQEQHTNASVNGKKEHRMMSPKRWILLLIFYISYLMFGASIYYHIEHRLEAEQIQEDQKERARIHSYLIDQLEDKNVTTQNEILERITDYCGKPVTDASKDDSEPYYKWTFYHAFFFAFTVCSTVGYGNISPTTTLGRMIMIVYSVIGIPVNGILFAGLGEYFGKTFQSIYHRYKKYKMSNDKHYVPPQLSLISTILIALVPGIALFLLIPSWVFSYFEGWSYSLAFYYSYVTTTTIGFGDYVPTFQPQQPKEFGGWFVVYQIFVIVWFIFSLGYLLMIMTFITRGLQSKKLSQLEQQLSSNIKATQQRIWGGVTKDVGYLRRILNELYIMKFKPVYTDEEEYERSLHRSNSCPELTMYRVDPIPIPSRKRAFSECYDAVEARAVGTPFMVHASSDTELTRIDRQKSFETAEAFRQTTGLLAKVVGALAAVKPPLEEEDTTLGASSMYGGYHGFSDSQILASEWSFPGSNEIPRPRGRACSDFNLNPKPRVRRTTVAGHNEWTWSGDNDQIQEAINVRSRQMDRDRENLYRSSFGLPTLDYMEDEETEEIKRKPSRIKKFSMPDGFRKMFPFKKRSSQAEFSGSDIEKANGRKFSVVSVPEIMQHQGTNVDYYSTVTANASPTFFRNGKPLPISQLHPSQGSLNKQSTLTNGHLPDSNAISNTSYQRNAAAAGARRRRESIFAQNPALAHRKGSLYPPAAAALGQRRGSLFTTERRGSTASAFALPPPRRGSLFPAAAANRRPSILSSTSQDEMEVLENTTLADLIRALEVVHTQAVLDEAAEASQAANQTSSGLSGLFRADKKKRKASTSALEPPPLPPILSLFGNDSATLKAAAANRLYARRSTIVGTLPQTSQQLQQTSITSNNSNNILNRRKMSTVQIQEPPPSYSEQATATLASAPTPAQSKFKRRFSVRPTALQIPPGKAPPPGVNINAAAEVVATPSQTVLQRRLSLRPSPLATTPSITTTAPDGSPTSPTATSSSSPSSTTRLLPLPARPSNTSTHSPLSRIVQISQAQRKSSMPDGFAARKPDK